MDWSQMPLFLLAAFTLAIAPGPDVIYVLTRGAAQGTKIGLAAAAGFGLGNLFHTLLAVVGLSALIAASPTAFSIVKYAGAAYLAWIGISMWRDKSSFENNTDSVRKPAFEVFKQSIFANMLNPKVAIFFLAFIPQFVNPESGSTSIQFLIYGIVFGIVGWIVFSFVAVASGAIGSLLKKSALFRNGLRYLAGSVLIGLAIKIAFTK